jgi:hypothetical protein
MRKPYQIIIWGSGRLGAMGIWEIAQSEALKLVGVRTYSDEKCGVDAGELVGIEPMGVTITNDVDALLEIDCDCVLYSVLDLGTWHTDEEIFRILAAGKNIVTMLPYQNAHLFRDKAFLTELESACEKGGSTFYADGIDPALINSRILLGLTGGCSDIKSIKLQENWDAAGLDERTLKHIGLGLKPEVSEQTESSNALTMNYTTAVIRTAEDTLGVKYDRIEEVHEFAPTPFDIHEPFFIPAGSVARLSHRTMGYVDSIGSKPFFTFEANWVVGPDMLPEGVEPGQYYVATIEGRPSMKMSLDLRVSNENDERFHQLGNMSAEPSYVATLAPCLQAIPHVVAAPAGLMPTFGPSLHWKQDLRDNTTR